MRSPTLLSIAFGAIALGFLAGAAFHAVGLARPDLMPVAVPPWRHALFIAVNGACAAGVIARPRWFPLAFAALVAQQVVSHGGDLATAWRAEGRIDWASVIVIACMPAILALLLLDARSRRSGRA